MVRAHHERPDGTGYPDGLRGDQIPLEAAIISACDSFDAMAHSRQYRPGLGRDIAITILREHSRRQWLPDAVDAVIAVVPQLDDAAAAFDAVGRPGASDHRNLPSLDH